jgi:hypothetical protein
VSQQVSTAGRPCLTGDPANRRCRRVATTAKHGIGLLDALTRFASRRLWLPSAPLTSPHATLNSGQAGAGGAGRSAGGFSQGVAVLDRGVCIGGALQGEGLPDDRPDPARHRF